MMGNSKTKRECKNKRRRINDGGEGCENMKKGTWINRIRLKGKMRKRRVRGGKKRRQEKKA